MHTDCKICSCDVYARWNCAVQRCPRDEHLIVDHKILALVMEKIKDYRNSHLNERFKRSINEINSENNKISYEELLKWIYGAETFEVKENKNSSETTTIKNNTNEIKDIPKQQGSNYPESELLSFNDLLHLGNERDKNIYKDTSHSESIFYMNNEPMTLDILKEIGNFETNEADDLNIINDRTHNVTNMNNNVTIDRNFNEKENFMSRKNAGTENHRFLRKRDVSTDANETIASVNYNNTINKMEDLQKNILSSLNKILIEKQNELEKLTNIKEKLILYLKSFGNISIPNDFHLNNVTNVTQDNKYSNIYFYQFEEIPQDLRKHDPNILDKYLKKLKRDIYEVIQDISGIQRLPNSSIPQDLKILVRAMKYYVNKENERTKISKTKHNNVNLRRDLNYRIEENNQPFDIIMNMLLVLDSDATTNDVLDTISSNARKILSRIIKTFYSDEFSTISSRLFDSFDILNTLNALENKWQSLSFNIAKIPIHERLYGLKYLHIMLSKDICKLHNILKLLEFAKSRRMTPVDEILGGKVVYKMANDIKRIKNIAKQITLPLKQRLKNKKHELNILKSKNISPVKKKSLFQKIKKMLKNSEKEIQNLFHKNISKSEIVKQIARKKMDEITKKKLSEYEEVMERWQDNLNIMSVREKRSAGEFKKFVNKIKHIIPSYLRGKVKPAIDKNKRNKTRSTTCKSKNNRRGKKKSTTPKTKLSKKLQRNHSRHRH